ncbi:DUF4184 family protein [Belliella kenyensis]|uniref:DUF4184 family protein n=1 Tax=Belliella kenyensis TaxID=1472724 RepID=A0ABV8EPU0_9BACT|nr:DUF4184 family protein [Belliella kenyensis]MCH7402277.1 DUF4184 family protein [Belliella kenyensis]MDN3601793.1 DUF4184 family protein [Belliella kenyensis]
MPFTFSHPAVLFPWIKRSENLSVTALVIGSIVPDLEFYFKLRLDENIGHTFNGIFLFDYPVALLCFVIFHKFIKRALIQFSPVFIKKRIPLDSMKNKSYRSRKSILLLLLSFSIGLASHLILDFMTHFQEGKPSLLTGLNFEVGIGNHYFPIYHILQLGFSSFGLLWIVIILVKLPKHPLNAFEKKSAFPFWSIVSLGIILASLIRIHYFPEFISGWDVFMMVVGAGLYSVLLSSILFWAREKYLSRNHRKCYKLVNSRSINPRFKTRTLSIKEDQSLTPLNQRIMEMDNFINKPKIIFTKNCDIQINGSESAIQNIIQMCSQFIGITSFGFTTQKEFKRRLIESCGVKISDFNFHTFANFLKYINPMNKFLVILLFIFSLSLQSLALQAIDVIDPSDREAIIQHAIQLRTEERFADAIEALDKILSINPSDAQILLFKGDLCLQNKDFNRAVETYDALIPLNFEATVTRINKSYALFMSKKPKKALSVAHEAWEADTLHQGAIVNFFNAMLWNSKTNDASEFLNKNVGKLNHDQYLVMNARLATSAGNYKKGLTYYDSLTQTFPVSHYILEYGEVLVGKKRWKEIQNLLDAKGEDLTDSQKVKLEGLINQAGMQTAGLQFGYFGDIGGNTRLEQSIFWENEITEPIQIGLRAGTSQVYSMENQKTNLSFFSGNTAYKWSPEIETRGEITFQQISPQNGEAFRGVTGRLATNYQPNDRRMVGLFYQSDILNFTAELLDKNIRSQDVGYVTHIMLDGRTGIFSQGSVGKFNDKNSRVQFFGSIYRLLRTEPTLKSGLNFSGLSFKDSETNLYFAPNQFLSSELFIDYSTPMPLVSKVALQIQLAGGLQKIEQLAWDPTFRGQVQFNYNVSGFDLGLKVQLSDVAGSSGTGYRFHYTTFRLSKKF